ncbi:MAG: hypothetical protein U0I70_02920 [Alistipes inops]|jgi:hypothetical protein|nr:hypothetical protein [Alistipes inops]DAT87900.1 MAG TPA: hypothetical protein [Caudoviricetes sp.]
MGRKDILLLKIFGEQYLEVFFLDSTLKAFSDGKPHLDITAPTEEVNIPYVRSIKYLLNNNMLETAGEGYRITAVGKLHLSKGGFVKDFIFSKLKDISYVLGIILSLLSIIVIIISGHD